MRTLVSISQLVPCVSLLAPFSLRNSGPLFTTTTGSIADGKPLTDDDSVPYFATPKKEEIEAPPIPPPHEFDDPVDLSVIVSWAEDIMSEQWGALENVKPLFYEMGMGYTQVAICVSEPSENIYVTFEGTNVMEFPDVFANLDIRMEDFGPPPDKIKDKQINIPGKVQRGWNRKVFNPKLYLPLSEKLRQTKEKYPDFQIVVAGHSMGASLAIFYAIYVAKYVFPDDGMVQVMNLGSPRIGNEEFYHAIQDIPNLRIWRLVYLDDIVPRCPPLWMGYRHVGHMLRWERDRKVRAYHEQLETSMDSRCYVGIEMKQWNILQGNLNHHEHDNYRSIIAMAKLEPEKYWPEGFEMI